MKSIDVSPNDEPLSSNPNPMMYYCNLTTATITTHQNIRNLLISSYLFNGSDDALDELDDDDYIICPHYEKNYWERGRIIPGDDVQIGVTETKNRADDSAGMTVGRGLREEIRTSVDPHSFINTSTCYCYEDGRLTKTVDWFAVRLEANNFRNVGIVEPLPKTNDQRNIKAAIFVHATQSTVLTFLRSFRPCQRTGNDHILGLACIRVDQVRRIIGEFNRRKYSGQHGTFRWSS